MVLVCRKSLRLPLVWQGKIIAAEHFVIRSYKRLWNLVKEFYLRSSSPKETKDAMTSSEFGSICSGGKRKPYRPFEGLQELTLI